MNLVYLHYSFIFDPSETWSRISMLDSDIASWLRSKGFDAILIETPQNNVDSKMIFVKKQDMLPIPKEPKVKSVGQQIVDLKRGLKDGRSKR